MSYWNYRIIKKIKNKEAFYQIHEVYYSNKNEIEAWTESPVLPFGETASELRGDIFYFMSAFKHPVLTMVKQGKKEKLVPDEEDTEINPGHYFELMDRASVALGHFEDFVASHPVVRKDEKLKKKAQKTVDALYGFYSKAAGVWEKEEKKENTIIT